jgi:hypothetical protein
MTENDSSTAIRLAIEARDLTDKKLMPYWFYFLVVYSLTLGLWGFVIMAQRIERIDRFSARKMSYYNALIDWTHERSMEDGREQDVRETVAEMRSHVQSAYERELRPINSCQSVVLTILTLGVYGLHVLYRMNRYWPDAMLVEQRFDVQVSSAWSVLGVLSDPVSFTADPSMRRGYAGHLIGTIVTLGIWGVAWDWMLHVDPDRLYVDIHAVEDSVMRTVCAA